MPLLAPVAFPLFGIVNGKCACGGESCGRVGKHPRVAWGALRYGDAVSTPEPGAGYGLKTGAAPKGSGVFVVDLDGPEAADAFAELGECPETYTVATARGAHLYFEHPGFYVSNSASDLAKGIDVRGDGGFVVGPGSPHRSGTPYELAVDVAPAPAPPWLLAWLRERSKPPAEVQPHAGDVVDPDERERRRSLFAAYCLRAPAAAEGTRDARLWPIVQHAALDLALPGEDIHEVISEHWNPRCDPPFDDEELRRAVLHKSHDAKTRSLRPAAEPPPVELARIFTLEAPPKPAIVAPARAPRQHQGIFWDAWDEVVEPPVWLVDGLIPAGTVGGLVAHGSSLKTWMMLSIGAAISKGAPWLGKYSTRRGRVVVLDYESGTYELRRRVRLLEGGRVEGLGAWSYPPKRIDDVELWKELAAIEGVVLVCVDSLAEGTTPGVDENDKAAAFPLQLAARYSEGTGASALFIHHAKKDDAGDARKAVRGSTAIFAAMDWCFGFELIEETPTYHRERVSCVKPCMGAKPIPFAIELTDSGMRLYEGVASIKAVKSADEIQRAIHDKLAEMEISKTHVTDGDNLLKLAGVDIKLGRTQLREMLGKRQIVKVDAVGFMLDTPDARVGRVLQVVRENALFTSTAAIAEASYVTTREVDELVQRRVLQRSADGAWLVVDNALRNS